MHTSFSQSSAKSGKHYFFEKVLRIELMRENVRLHGYFLSSKACFLNSKLWPQCGERPPWWPQWARPPRHPSFPHPLPCWLLGAVEQVEVRVCDLRGQITERIAFSAVVLWISCLGRCPLCHRDIESVPRKGPRGEELRSATKRQHQPATMWVSHLGSGSSSPGGLSGDTSVQPERLQERMSQTRVELMLHSAGREWC